MARSSGSPEVVVLLELGSEYRGGLRAATSARSAHRTLEVFAPRICGGQPCVVGMRGTYGDGWGTFGHPTTHIPAMLKRMSQRTFQIEM